MRQSRLSNCGPLFLCLLTGTSPAAVLSLEPVNDPTAVYRWADASDNPYSSGFQMNYHYSQASVSLEFAATDSAFHGRLEAVALKPNFAYQLKLIGDPETPPDEKIGTVGRWWQEEWSGGTWANGWNLNNKGDGSTPSPNDLTYLARRGVTDASSPTGLRYRYTEYLVIAYLITDENGDAALEFEADSSYHVL